MSPSSRPRRRPPLPARAVTLSALLVGLLAAPLTAASPPADRWHPVSPEGGSVSALTRVPQAPATLYATAFNGGLSRSTDGGLTWTSLLPRLPEPRLRLVKVSSDGATVVASTGDDARFWVSHDGGETWRQGAISGTSPFFDVDLLAVAPSDARRIYSASLGAWRSDDGGASWSPVHPAGPDDLLLGLAVHPTDADRLWAIVFADGVYRSLDGGRTWERTLATDRVPIERWGAIVIDPADPDLVSVAGRDGFRVSRDGGKTWSEPRGESILRIAADPSAPGHLLVVQRLDDGNPPAEAVYALDRISTDGTRRTRLQTLDALVGHLRPGTSGLPFLATLPGTGVVIVDPGEPTGWRPANTGLRINGVTAFGLAPSAPSILYAGLDRPFDLVRSRDGAAAWGGRRPLNGSPDAPAARIVVHPHDPETVYVLLVNAVLRLDGGPGVHRRLLQAFHLDLEMDPWNPSRLYVVTGNALGETTHHLFISDDAGDHWREIPLPAGTVEGRDLALDPTRPGVLYLGTGDSVLRSRDGGESWVATGVGVLPRVTRLAVQPGDGGTRLFAVAGGDLYASDDGGDTWSRREDGLPPGTVRSVAASPRRDGPVLVGVDREGVYRRRGSGPWQPLGEGLPKLIVEQVGLVPGTDVAFAALRDGGLWRLGVPADCPPQDGRLLCLRDGRFRVDVRWRTSSGDAGAGSAGTPAPDPARQAWGWLWFFDPANAELAVKLLDGRPVNGRWWVFYASMTDVAFDLLVTDLEHGAFRLYPNRAGHLASRGDTVAFPADPSPQEGTGAAPAAGPNPRTSTRTSADCGGPPGALCLQDGRFRVEVEWEDFADSRGTATGVPLARDSGFLWFFQPSNPEIFVKVLDGRPVNGRWWVFYGALSNVRYTVTVTDTASGAAVTYDNPAGTFDSVADTAAF